MQGLALTSALRLSPNSLATKNASMNAGVCCVGGGNVFVRGCVVCERLRGGPSRLKPQVSL